MRQTIKIGFDVPNPGYNLKIQNVYKTPEQLIVVSRLKSPSGMCIACLGHASDSISVEVDQQLPVKHYVIGVRKDAWFNKPNLFTAVDSADQITELKSDACIAINSQLKCGMFANSKIPTTNDEAKSCPFKARA